MSRWQGVSNTAHFTAQVWVRSKLPCAEYFDTPRGRLLYHTTAPFLSTGPRLANLPVLEDILLSRHRMIDQILIDFEPDQVIEFAAGLSPRGLWYSDAFGTPYLDVDLPGIVQTKRERIGGAAGDLYRLTEMDLDVSEDYGATLSPYLRPGKTAVIAEGLLLYLPLSLQERIFGRIGALLGQLGGGCFVADVHHEQDVRLAGPLIGAFRRLLHLFSRTQLPQQIPTAEAGQQLMREKGFHALTIHRPEDWRQRLNLNIGVTNVGLSIYQATLPRIG